MLLLLLTLLRLVKGAASRALARRSADADDRSLETAIQNINGLISILTLLPVLTGKSQNVKLAAGRILPASFVLAGIGAGRVLAKLQLGILLFSYDLYRNTVSDLSYPHDEYVNKFSPRLDHLPTDTPERHATGAYINHNPSETYMVEAWFQTQGLAAEVELRQNNHTRMLVAVSLHVLAYAGETYLALRNAAIGSGLAFIIMQAISVILWIAATTIVQVRKGQGKRDVQLNRLQSSEYRCFRLPMPGHHVASAVLSFHLNNLQGFRIFGSAYEKPALVLAGAMFLISGVLDMLSTVLIVGKTTWAYPWIAVELAIIAAKVVFCVEPFRHMEIKQVRIQDDATREHKVHSNPTAKQLPLQINTDASWQCREVCTDYNIFEERETGVEWRSSSAGIWIGQEYRSIVQAGSGRAGGGHVKFLALLGSEPKKLGLVDERPSAQSNQALQREFLAALAVLVQANSVASNGFLAAIDRTLRNIESSMQTDWYRFGAKEVIDAFNKAKTAAVWRRWL